MLDAQVFESAYAKAMAADAMASRPRVRRVIGYTESFEPPSRGASLMKPITVLGVTYKSKKAFAAALGVGESAVRKAEKSGRIEAMALRFLGGRS